jgi:hypothetical protein
MAPGNENDLAKIKRTLAWYNMIPNLIWSIINLTPVTIFCFTLIELKTVYIFLAASLIPIFLKNSFLDKLQIGRTSGIYKKLGVHVINKLAQNGAIINALMKRKFPGYKTVFYRQKSISSLINQTYVFEKFHLICFLFFSLIVIYAFVHGHMYWASIILLTNLGYNIYPNLLQQYIRVKLKLFRQANRQF